MIERIIEFSIRNRFLVLILACALTVAGVFAVLVLIAVGKTAAGRKGMAFRVDLFNALTLGAALVAFLGFYFDDGASISRVTAPFLLLSLLVLVATGCRTWLLAAAIVAQVLVAPSFLTKYRDWRGTLYTYNRARADLFDTQLSPLLAFEDGKGPWCNTLLTMSYQPEIALVPAGIGLVVGSHPEETTMPIKSRFLLLNGNGPKAYGEKTHLRHLGATTLGELYLNTDAACQ